MQMIQVPIGQTFPILLGCCADGSVALLKPNGIPIKPIFENLQGDAVSSAFHVDHVHLFNMVDNIELEYNTTYQYKKIPLLLAWLKQQNLQPPQF